MKITKEEKEIIKIKRTILPMFVLKHKESGEIRVMTVHEWHSTNNVEGEHYHMSGDLKSWEDWGKPSI